jgi:hypothetical protein
VDAGIEKRSSRAPPLLYGRQPDWEATFTLSRVRVSRTPIYQRVGAVQVVHFEEDLLRDAPGPPNARGAPTPCTPRLPLFVPFELSRSSAFVTSILVLPSLARTNVSEQNDELQMSDGAHKLRERLSTFGTFVQFQKTTASLDAPYYAFTINHASSSIAVVVVVAAACFDFHACAMASNLKALPPFSASSCSSDIF